jgi:hypothetical protein
MSFRTTVRVGIEVTRIDSKWFPYDYHMFHCRQKDYKLQDWAESVVWIMGQFGGIPGVEKIGIDETRRYWVHIELSGYKNYLGEYEDEVTIIKATRADRKRASKRRDRTHRAS